MLDRVATYGVPILAGLLTGLVLLGPGRERPAMGARAYGELREGAVGWALRVETLSHLKGRYYPVQSALEVDVVQAGERLGRWTGGTDRDGIADAAGPLARPVSGWLELEVRAHDRLLGHGRALLGARLAALPPAGPLDGEAHGPLGVSVVLGRGITVPGIAEALAFHVAVPRSVLAAGAARAETPVLSLSATGAEVGPLGEPSAKGCDDSICGFSWLAPIVLQAPSAELTVSARTPNGQTGSWRGPIPVALGGLWIDPTSVALGALLVRSAVPRPRAYLSLISTTGRFWGSTVELEDVGEGQSRGSVPLPSLPQGPLLGVVSSDPFEPEQTATGWPLLPEQGSIPQLRPALLCDGMPAAIRQEANRRARMRRAACAAILGAGGLELAYLWRRYRAGRRGLARLQAEADRSAPKGAGEPHSPDAQSITTPMGLGWAIMLSTGVTLAFVALAALAAWG